MENIDELHRKYVTLESNIQFYKQEINFLLKILTKEYSISITNEKIIKLLDSYWKEFEKHHNELETLEAEIKKEAHEISSLYKNEEHNISQYKFDEKKLFNKYSKIISSLKILKEHLYNYMESDMKHKLTLRLL